MITVFLRYRPARLESRVFLGKVAHYRIVFATFFFTPTRFFHTFFVSMRGWIEAQNILRNLNIKNQVILPNIRKKSMDYFTHL